MKFQTYQSKLIEENHQQFLTECERACYKLDDNFPAEDKTWTYYKYNMFVVTAGSKIFYNLFKEMQWCIRNFCQTKEPLWWGCWLNYHESNKVLDWHNHGSDYHGYISIDPKNTITEFEKWKVNNKIGQIYIGEGGHQHRVIVNEPYEGYRLTLGLDIWKNLDFYEDLQENDDGSVTTSVLGNLCYIPC